MPRLTNTVEAARLLEVTMAVSRYERALGRCPHGHPDRSKALYVLATALLTKYPLSADQDTLDRVVLLLEQALELRPAGHPDRPESLTGLATAFKWRFERSGNRSDLDKAILLNEQALQLYPLDHLHRLGSLNNLATALLVRFELLGDRADINKVVALHEQALGCHSPGPVERSLLLESLAGALGARFQELGDRADLEQAVLLHEEAVSLCPPGHPDRSLSLNNLATTLLTRFGWSGDWDDLERPVLLLEQALELRPPGHVHRSSSLINLAEAYKTRFEQLGDRTDLDKAVLLQEEVVKLRPPKHFRRSSCLTNLASSLFVRFNQSGDRADLDRVVLLFEQALELCPPGHIQRSIMLNNLASAVGNRFGASGSLVDLDRKVSLHEQALELRPCGHPLRSSALNSLAGALTMRFDNSRHQVDLDKAIQMFEQVLKLRPPGHKGRSKSLHNLAMATKTRFEVSRSHEDLDEAVYLLKQALQLHPLGHVDHSASLVRLSQAVLTRFKQSSDRTDFEQVLSWCHDGLGAITESDPHRCTILMTLREAWTARFRLDHIQSDLKQGLDAFSRGARLPLSPLPSRFRVAALWARISIEFAQWLSAVTACRTVITLLPQLLWLELDLPSRLSALKRARGLVRDGAACAIRISKLTDAVELLEGGRSIFWTHMLQLRAPFDHLPPPYPQKLADISRALRAFTTSDVFLGRSFDGKDSAAENVRRRKLLDDWSQALEGVRRTPGFKYFFLPRPFKELSQVAQHGPVVILNASSELGCSAVVIKSPESSPEHVALPAMKFTQLERLRCGLPRATGRDTERYMEFAPPPCGPDLHQILKKLWVSVVKPLIEFLGLRKSDSPRRLWWCPTGLFSFMPVHAAGIYNADDPTDVSEYAISSYIPTLEALTTARSRPVPAHDDKVLVIIQPKTPGKARLPWTVDERQVIEKVVPSNALLPLTGDSASPTPMDGSDATVENVLSKLPKASIAHFACHGTQRNDDPLKSALHLQDGPLTLDGTIHQDLPNASIAFLSACQSAAGDNAYPDEVIHLGAGMLAAGFQSVIATMWTMQDCDGPLVAEEVYKELFRIRPDPRRTAHALHAAIRKLRQRGTDLAAWVPFIHLGV